MHWGPDIHKRGECRFAHSWPCSKSAGWCTWEVSDSWILHHLPSGRRARGRPRTTVQGVLHCEVSPRNTPGLSNQHHLDALSVMAQDQVACRGFTNAALGACGCGHHPLVALAIQLVCLMPESFHAGGEAKRTIQHGAKLLFRAGSRKRYCVLPSVVYVDIGSGHSSPTPLQLCWPCSAITFVENWLENVS